MHHQKRERIMHSHSSVHRKAFILVGVDLKGKMFVTELKEDEERLKGQPNWPFAGLLIDIDEKSGVWQLMMPDGNLLSGSTFGPPLKLCRGYGHITVCRNNDTSYSKAYVVAENLRRIILKEIKRVRTPQPTR